MRKHDTSNPDWEKIKFMIFDAPLIDGDFMERIEKCKRILTKIPKTVCHMLPQVVCSSKERLGTIMDQVLSEKGEGVMLKDPLSCYEGKRSHSLLKVKRFEDAEATVIGHHDGVGRI